MTEPASPKPPFSKTNPEGKSRKTRKRDYGASISKEPLMPAQRPPRMGSLLRSIKTDDEFFKSLSNESDRGVALLAAAELDVNLEETIVCRMRSDLNKEDINLIFGETGFLSSFAAKIRTAYALNFYGQVTKQNLLIISAIRNIFAHSALALNFNNELINLNCSHLNFLEECDRLKIATSPSVFKPATARERFLLTTSIICSLLWKVNANTSQSKVYDFLAIDAIVFERDLAFQQDLRDKINNFEKFSLP